ncbi:MAG: hypothetical protein IJN02_11690 [Bacteroidales bacterium]|nr:hypothetical protein [Bacteroidales bacterium]MBQ6689877.1 hypothetical protein [Bacteroidales bacterium]
MKKVVLFLAVAAGTLLLASCNKSTMCKCTSVDMPSIVVEQEWAGDCDDIETPGVIDCERA